ncbi:major facilitator superfamily-like protein [Aureococcus anophagefferens]|nr:major facilitator superfamily-like protein [Aureococcus anophagefferens]
MAAAAGSPFETAPLILRRARALACSSSAAAALLREGIEATSAKLRVLPRGSRVRRLEAAEDARGKRRLRVAADGADGWLSEALVEAEPAADDGWPEVAAAPPWAPGDSLAPFLTTPVAFLDEALADVAGVGPADVVVDLGCGDGRIRSGPGATARRCGGVELDGALVDVARANVAARRLADVVDIVHGDLAADDDPQVAALLEAATLLTVFLLPEAEPAVEPIVRRHVARGGRALFLGWLPRGYERLPRILQTSLDPVPTVAAGDVEIGSIADAGRVGSITRFNDVIEQIVEDAIDADGRITDETMVEFGLAFQRSRRPEWVSFYIDYDALKRLLATAPWEFLAKLVQDIETCALHSLEEAGRIAALLRASRAEAGLEALLRLVAFVELNLVAVRKILKKHDKTFEPCTRAVARTAHMRLLESFERQWPALLRTGLIRGAPPRLAAECSRAVERCSAARACGVRWRR